MSHEPGPANPVTVIRAHLDGSTPGLYVYALVRQSFAALLLDGAAAFADEVLDLGPAAVPPARIADVAGLRHGEMRHMGLARGGRWLAWFLPGRPGQVPS